MPHEHVVLLEDDPLHAVALSQELLNEGYQLDVVRTIEEVEQSVGSGVRKAIIDLRLSGPTDNSGLQAIGRIKRKFPSTYVVVCSEIADEWRGWAIDEGADAIVTKQVRQMRATALEIVTHFLRHDAGHGIIRFWGSWVGVPLLAGAWASWAQRKAGITIALVGPTRTYFLPLLAALLFVLTVSVTRARRESSIAKNRVFVLFLEFRWWLVTALAGEVAYNLLTSILKG